MLERCGGFVIGVLTVFILAIAGVAMAIPDGGRYLRIKNM
jgi:hypothetical protein